MIQEIGKKITQINVIGIAPKHQEERMYTEHQDQFML